MARKVQRTGSRGRAAASQPPVSPKASAPVTPMSHQSLTPEAAVTLTLV